MSAGECQTTNRGDYDEVRISTAVANMDTKITMSHLT